MRPIDADALKEHIKKRIRNEMIIAWLFRIIDEVSTIDPASLRPKGEWIEKQEAIPWCEDDVDVFWECAVCGTRNYAPTDFCPNCGADMRGEGDG